jgi:hypothetical protein
MGGVLAMFGGLLLQADWGPVTMVNELPLSVSFKDARNIGSVGVGIGFGRDSLMQYVDRCRRDTLLPFFRSKQRSCQAPIVVLIYIYISRAHCFLGTSLTVLHLHERMGHPVPEPMCTAVNFGAWKNLKITAEQVHRVMNQNPCLPCMLAKKNKPSIANPEKGDLTELKIDKLLSGDIVGKIQPAKRDGDIYFHLFVDKRSGCMRAYMSKTKDSFVTALQDTIAYFENFGHKVKAFQSDLEQIMKWGPVKQLLECKGIQPEHSLPFANYQNLV